jgi:serine/threonine protein kinase
MTSDSLDPTIQKARARIGITLCGKWTLERLLGVGGMAAVYAASHRNGARGAIKMLHRELSLDPDIRQRFLREAYVSNQVDHPGAVRVLDDDTAEDGSAFLVLELLLGESLDARLERSGGRLETLEALCLLDQLLSTLIAAHDKGIVHRDIKPENLFLTGEGQLKLLDFGIARVRDASGASATRTGSTMGTPAFMPPEQALGRTREIGPASDIWAAGATLFTLLSGRFVHLGETANEILVAAATQPAPSLGAVAPWVPPDVVVVVDQAVAFQVAQRWPNAASMQYALRLAYHSLSGASSPSSTPLQDGQTVAASPLPSILPPAKIHTTQTARPADRPGDPLLAGQATTGSGSTSVRTLLPPSSLPPRWEGGRRWGGVGLAVGGLALGVTWALLRSRPDAAPSSAAEAGAPAWASGASVAVPPSATAPASADEQPPPEGAPVQRAQGDGGAAATTSGTVHIAVKGGACELLVDGAVVGRGEELRLELPAGDHRLVCRAPQLALERRLRVVPGRREDVVFRIPTLPSTSTPAPKDPRDRRR